MCVCTHFASRFCKGYLLPVTQLGMRGKVEECLLLFSLISLSSDDYFSFLRPLTFSLSLSRSSSLSLSIPPSLSLPLFPISPSLSSLQILLNAGAPPLSSSREVDVSFIKPGLGFVMKSNPPGSSLFLPCSVLIKHTNPAREFHLEPNLSNLREAN